MAKPVLAAVMAATLLVTACAVPSQPYLDDAQAKCVQGNQDACGQVVPLQAAVNQEKNDQAGKIAKGILLGIAAFAVGAAAGYSAAHPVPPPPPAVFILQPPRFVP